MFHVKKFLPELTCIVFTCSLLNPLNAELNPICHLLALLGAHHILHVGRIRVKQILTLHQHRFKLTELLA